MIRTLMYEGVALLGWWRHTPNRGRGNLRASVLKEMPVDAPWLHETDEEGLTPLNRGISSGNASTVSLMLSISQSPDSSKDQPIHVAAREMRVSAVRRLIERGADMDATDGSGLTALHWAAVTGCMDLARLLVNRGAHINPREENVTDMTPTALARCMGYKELARFLSDHGGLD